MSLRIGSLCSGYGGLDLAVESVLDARTVWFCEYARDPSAILAHHWPHIPNHGDVKATDWATVEPIDVLTAGYPCQPFSHAGKRKGADDPRHLWPDVARAIGVLRPRLVVLENVRGHVSLGLADVLGDLADLGYDATWGVVRADDAGAAHGRARIFIVAEPVGERHDGSGTARAAGGSRSWWRDAARSSDATPDASGIGWGEGWAEPAGRVGRPAPVERGAVAPDADYAGCIEHWRPITVDAKHHPVERSVEWGDYGPAISRWTAVLGRPAPAPTEPGRNDRPRLSPAFVEWLMGLPVGHVTDPVIGLSRNAQLKALGNGVVPQQAALALRLLLPRAEVAA